VPDPPLCSEVDLAALGVHAPLAAPAFERDADHRIEAAVGGGDPVVIVVGPRLGGATHALARAARLLLGDHRVIRPDPATLGGSDPLASPADPALVASLAGGGALPGSPGLVVWLDAVGPALLGALRRARPPAGVRILATADSALLHPDVVRGDVGDGVTVVRLPETLSAAEAAHAEAVGLSVPSGSRLGEGLVDLTPHRGLLVPGDSGRSWRPGRRGEGRTTTARAAVLRAAVDWDRLGVPHALPTPLLARLALAYARDLAGDDDGDGPDSVPGVDDLGRAVESLVAERPRRGEPPLLRRLRLSEGVHHVPSGLLTAAADALGADGWTPPARLGEVVGDVLDPPQVRARRRAVGVLALARRFDDLAALLLRPPPDGAAPGSTTPGEHYRLGVASLQAGRPAEARRWFAAVLAGTPDDGTERSLRARTAFWLGLDRDAEPTERRRHLELVVRDGPPRDASDAGLLLAGLERDAGRFDAQRGCLRAAVASAREAGDDTREAEASLDLAHLDRLRGRTVDARAAYSRVRELLGDDSPGGSAAARSLAEMETAARREPDDGDDEHDDDGAGRAGTDGLVPDPVPEQRQDEPAPAEGPRASL
jgi:tetratricopeptide (TPR) repeat protein